MFALIKKIVIMTAIIKCKIELKVLKIMFAIIRRLYGNMSISKKITLICSIFFIALIILINVVMSLGISYALLYPAEATVKHAIDTSTKIFKSSTEPADENIFYEIRKNIVAGVVFRVYEGENLIFDTNTELYPTNEEFEKNIIENKPIMANDDMDIAQLKNALVYRAEKDFELGGKEYTFYFYRTITSQVGIFEDLVDFMLTVDALSLIFSVIVSYIISQKILRPLTEMTALAKKITLNNERDSVKDRIPIPPANDEMTELAKTFNEMLDRMQGDITKHKNFVSDASHELKNPLTVIEGYAKILEKFGNADPSLRDESVIAIREEVQNMNKLIERLRSLTKSVDGKTLQLNKENFNLAEVVDVAFQRAKNISTNHEIILVQNDSAQIFGDKTALLQMLRIFIDNAIKYSPEGGTIRLSSIRQDDKIFVSVADTGIGIAAENIDKLFVRGVRLTKDKYVKNVEGSGIGLDMAKKIADGHGITIDVESIVGKGTTFTLKIPLI